MSPPFPRPTAGELRQIIATCEETVRGRAALRAYVGPLTPTPDRPWQDDAVRLLRAGGLTPREEHFLLATVGREQAPTPRQTRWLEVLVRREASP